MELRTVVEIGDFKIYRDQFCGRSHASFFGTGARALRDFGAYAFATGLYQKGNERLAAFQKWVCI